MASFFSGTPASFQQISKFSPQQMSGIQQQLGMGMDQSAFNPIEQRARTQFQTRTLPSIAERFTSLGGGAQRSSGFADILGRAGSGLESDLAAQRAQYGLQQQGLQNQLLTTPQFDTVRMPRESSGFESLLSGLLPALGYGAGMAFGGPLGAGLGGAAGGGLASLLGGLGGQQQQQGGQLSPQELQFLRSLLSRIGGQ